MAYNGAVFAGSLVDINIAAAGALGFLNPLLGGFDFALYGSFGLSGLQANLQAQLQAALQASLDIGIGISNPYLGFQAALAGIGLLQAQISLALSGAIPAVSLEIGGQLSALALFAALLSAQIGGLEAILQLGLSLKIPATDFAAGLAGSLGAGPLVVVTFENMPLISAGAALNAHFSTGVTFGTSNILPGDTVYGILLLTKAPGAWAAVGATMRTS